MGDVIDFEKKKRELKRKKKKENDDLFSYFGGDKPKSKADKIRDALSKFGSHKRNKHHDKNKPKEDE